MSTAPQAPEAERFRLYDAAGTHALIAHMARQAVVRVAGHPTTVIGVLRRGAPLADLLVAAMRELMPNLDIARMDLKVKRYSDDLHLLHPDTHLDATPEQVRADFAGRRVIVVDDVLYQGYSLFRVLEFVRTRHPAAMFTAVLVDRRAQRIPVSADIVGATVQIAPDQVIECNVPPFEPELAVDVWHPPAVTG
ncbi:MAG: phosphoribosyltransferase family protein [Xanthomonadaceae bacterium]|nr:phosphoribosyltransferase family protein [Xanthomonadaceae bacterium]